MRAYEVTVKVLVHGPENYSRTIEKLVHGLVQDTLPGIETKVADGTVAISGASAVECKDVGEAKEDGS